MTESLAAPDAVWLWRALLLASGDAATAETATRVAVRKAIEAPHPSRAGLWLVGFEELRRLQETDEVLVLSLGVSGPQAADTRAIASHLTACPDRDRRLLLGCYLARFSAQEVSLVLGEELDEDRLEEWRTYYSLALASAALVETDKWRELVSSIEAPFDAQRLFDSTDGQPRFNTWLVAAAAAGVLTLLLAVSSAGRDTTLDEPDSERAAQPAPSGDASGRAAPECAAIALSNSVSVSPVVERRLSPQELTAALSHADLVIRADVESVATQANDVVFEVSGSELIFGEAPSPPTSLRLAARLGGDGTPKPTEVIAFVRQEASGWSVTETGGMWAECEGGQSVPIGVEWAVGSDWPADPGPTSLPPAIAAVLEDNAIVELASVEDRRSGGIQLLDGRSVVLDVPDVLAPSGSATAAIERDDVLATFFTSTSQIVVQQAPCSTAPEPASEPGNTVSIVCSSDGSLRLELTTANPLTERELSLVDAYVVSDDDVNSQGLALVAGSGGDLVAVDVSRQTVRWRSEVSVAQPAFVSAAGDIGVVGSERLVVVDAATGSIRWSSAICSGTSATRIGSGWVVMVPGTRGPSIALVEPDRGDVVWVDAAERLLLGADDDRVIVKQESDGLRTISGLDTRTGAVVWTTETQQILGESNASTVSVDLERNLMVTLSAGEVELFDVADGQRRWSTTVPSAQEIDGLWTNTLTIATASGRTIKLGFVDGFILPP